MARVMYSEGHKHAELVRFNCRPLKQESIVTGIVLVTVWPAVMYSKGHQHVTNVKLDSTVVFLNRKLLLQDRDCNLELTMESEPSIPVQSTFFYSLFCGMTAC